MRFFAGINVVISLLLSVVALSSCSPQDRYIEFSGFAQGGVYTVKMNLNGRDGMIRSRPQEIKDSVDAILGRVDASLSGYNKKSLLSRFNDGQKIVPDEMFLDIYEKAYDVCKDTDGVVDAASAALFDIWGFGFKNGEMPDDEHVAEVLGSCGFKRLSRGIRAVYETEGTVGAGDLLEDASGTLVKLNYNALAQGYSCDKVAEYLYGIGVKDMMVDIGEIFCDGVNPSGKEWGIGIDRPVDGNNSPGSDLQAVFRVPKGPHGVVTSGNYRKFYVKDGKKYAHTIDPRTGYPVTHNLLSAAILAADGFTADAYATYCMVVGLEESVRFIESTPEIEGCLVYDDNGEFKTWTSSGMTLSGL
jgi:thiamine biosynthesis lipoprotein